MKFLFDFFPLILFFVAFKFADIFVATGIAIAATLAQIGWSLLARHRIAAMQWTSLAVIVVFGGATLVLHDETFIKWKPTVLYWAGGGALLVGLAFGRNLVKSIMGEDLALPEPVWSRLCVAWGVFFLFAGALNLFVAFRYSTDTWVNFKVWGGIGLFLVFALAQGVVLARYLSEPSQ
ncbi:MAG TPA: septation protein A [Usitatibacter sp.]|nr:septation protein A [Usitatibacter sp.]